MRHGPFIAESPPTHQDVEDEVLALIRATHVEFPNKGLGEIATAYEQSRKELTTARSYSLEELRGKMRAVRKE